METLNDAFEIGKIHFTFATYDLNHPSGQRQTNNIQIYLDAADFLEICRQISSGEFRWQMNKQRENSDTTPLFSHLGGTAADKLRQYGRPRADGMSLSRTAQILPGKKVDLLFVADSGPGETDSKGLIVPRFGKNPENHVSVGMTFQSLSKMFLLTKAHYDAWLSAWYYKEIQSTNQQ